MLSLQEKKLLRKVLSFRLERVLLLVNVILFTYAIIYHITLNGFNLTSLLLESFIYYSMAFSVSYGIKEIRKDLKKDLL